MNKSCTLVDVVILLKGWGRISRRGVLYAERVGRATASRLPGRTRSVGQGEHANGIGDVELDDDLGSAAPENGGGRRRAGDGINESDPRGRSIEAADGESERLRR